MTDAASPPVPQGGPTDMPALARFGRYQVRRMLGRGGMGAAYLAHEPGLDRPVVLKVISGADVSPDLVERLHREARAAARITSDHVVRVYETGKVDDVPYIAME